jgi:glycosyltransferase involved in cell wall biosynthesis
MKNKPLVSIVMPTYNRAYILPRTIKIALNQTYRTGSY